MSRFTLEKRRDGGEKWSGVRRWAEWTVCDVMGGVLPMATSILLTPDISGIPTRPASIVLRRTFHSFSSGKGKEKNWEQGGRGEQKKEEGGVWWDDLTFCSRTRCWEEWNRAISEELRILLYLWNLRSAVLELICIYSNNDIHLLL